MLHSRSASGARDFRLGRAPRDRRGIGAARRRTGDDRHDAVTGRISPPNSRVSSSAAPGLSIPGAQPNTPTNVTEAALTAASSVKADGLLAIGGGTAIGLSKAISLRTEPARRSPCRRHSPASKWRHSSARRNAARGSNGASQDIRPRTTIYDPELVAHLPPSVAGPSAMNAMANASTRCARRTRARSTLSPRRKQCALSAPPCRAFSRIQADDAAWSDALYGAWLAGVGVSSSTIHSRLCQTLVDTFGLVHAEVHCVMLPYTAVYRRDFAPERDAEGSHGDADR